MEVVKDYNDDNPLQLAETALPVYQTNHHVRKRTNITAARSHAIRIEMQSGGGDAGVEEVATFGESSDIFIG
jgi:hypothetical protein